MTLPFHVFLTLAILGSPATITALKHSYYTGRHGDDRTFIGAFLLSASRVLFAWQAKLLCSGPSIFLCSPLVKCFVFSLHTGPLGFPFGFLDTGHYNLTVFDFVLAAPNKPHKHDPHQRHHRLEQQHRSLAAPDPSGTPPPLTDSIKGVGFLLKKFPDEAAFNHYMNWVQANSSRCIFQQYLERDDDDFGLYDLDDDYHFDYDYGNFEDLDDYLYEGGGDGSGDDLFGPGNPPDDDTIRRLSPSQQRRRRQEDRLGYGEVMDAVEDGIFLDMLPRSRWKPNRPSVVYDFEAGEAGLYFLMYQVCFRDDINKNKNQLLDIHSKFELDFHFSNLDALGNESYLPAGEMPLPWIFFLFSIVYGVLLYLWVSNIVLIKEGKPGHFNTGDAFPPPSNPLGRGAQLPTATVYPIHYMMAFLLTLKFMSLLFESIRYHYLRVTGNAVFWSAVYYTFAFLKGITLFTVILLIGSGWSFVKPFLSDREKKMIFAILVLQVVNNIAIVVLTQETEGEKSFDRWTAILHLVDIFCCCAVLIPIVWQVNQLEKNMQQNQHQDEDGGEEGTGLFDEDQFEDEHIGEDELEGAGGGANSAAQSQRPPDARLASKLKLFRSFYLLVVAYIYITRIVVYLFAATLDYRHTWIRYFVVELVTLIFYCTVGMLFRPMNENPYLHIRRKRNSVENGTKLEMKKIDPKTKSVID